jgi:UDP-N-acetylglucosamine/UDP-N-acetyl-alpha-D-glucosaminouronate 4-epimerase
MSISLVTGGAGFIGSNLVEALVKRGQKVRVIDNFATGKRENLKDLWSKIDFREVDLLDEAGLRQACEGVDTIFHQAAIPSVPRSVTDPLMTHRVNVDGTVNLLIAARDARVRRVVYAASSSAYGDTPTLPKSEEMLPSPISPYAVQKLAGELYMTSFHRVYEMETVSLRYFNVFGPRQDAASPYSGVLAKFITEMLQDQAPTIHGDGKQSRDFTYIDNAVQANLKAAAAPAEKVAGKTFNVATGERYDLNQTFNILKKILGFEGKAIYGESRAGDVKHSLADISAGEEALGYAPEVGFEEGLRRTVDWYRSTHAAQSVTASTSKP